jgi:hypothetical protein
VCFFGFGFVATLDIFGRVNGGTPSEAFPDPSVLWRPELFDVAEGVVEPVRLDIKFISLMGEVAEG